MTVKATANALLMNSCAEGNSQRAEIALNYGANVNHQDRFGIRPILIAIQNCDHALIEMLLRRGADIRCIGSDDLYPMAQVAMMDKIEVLESIGAHCWDTEAPSPLLPSALEHALSGLKLNAARSLIRHGADIHTLSIDRKNLLMREVENLNFSAADELKNQGSLWFQQDKFGQNAIDYIVHAVEMSNGKMTDSILSNAFRWVIDEPLIDPTRLFCIKPIVKIGEHHHTDIEDDEREKSDEYQNIKLIKTKKEIRKKVFFHWIEMENYKRLRNTKSLITSLAKCDLQGALGILSSKIIVPNVRDQDGYPLPHLAIKAAERSRLLIGKKHATEDVDVDTMTKKYSEIEELLTNVIIALSKNGTKENIVDATNGNTIGHELVSGQFSSVYIKLYDQGLLKGSLNRSNFKQDRLLHIAVRRRDINTIEALLNRKCDRNPVNKDGHTPLHHCALHVDAEVASRLISAGANYNLLTRRGQSIKSLLDNIGKKATAFQALLQTRDSLQKVMGIFSHDNPMSALVKSGMGNFKRPT